MTTATADTHKKWFAHSSQQHWFGDMILLLLLLLLLFAFPSQYFCGSYFGQPICICACVEPSLLFMYPYLFPGLCNIECWSRYLLTGWIGWYFRFDRIVNAHTRHKQIINSLLRDGIIDFPRSGARHCLPLLFFLLFSRFIFSYIGIKYSDLFFFGNAIVFQIPIRKRLRCVEGNSKNSFEIK